MVHDLHVDQSRGTATDHRPSASEQIAGATHLLRIDVADGKVPASQEHGQFLQDNSIALGFSSVDGFEVQRVSQQKGQFAA